MKVKDKEYCGEACALLINLGCHRMPVNDMPFLLFLFRKHIGFYSMQTSELNISILVLLIDVLTWLHSMQTCNCNEEPLKIHGSQGLSNSNLITSVCSMFGLWMNNQERRLVWSSWKKLRTFLTLCWFDCYELSLKFLYSLTGIIWHMFQTMKFEPNKTTWLNFYKFCSYILQNRIIH